MSYEDHIDDDGNVKPLKKRTYEVHMKDGVTVHKIVAQYAFNNGPDGLTFRRGKPPFTRVVANFAAGEFRFFKEVSNDGE
jgi:hypothetical protein